MSVMLLALTVFLPACRFHNIEFRRDLRVEITSPDTSEELPLPITLKWKIKDRDLAERMEQGGREGFFLVLFNRSPMPPTRGINELADRECRRRRDCPDRQWLNDHFIFATTGTSLTLPALPDMRTSERRGVKDAHEATIVIMDQNQRRVRESSFSVRFFVDRSS